VAPDRPFEPEKRMNRTLLSAVGLALALAALPVCAKGDAARGKTLAYTCTGCHGIVDYKNAYPSYRVPKIAGQSEQYLVAALTAYQKGERQHPTMQAQADGQTAQSIADIAAYLSSLKPAE
jgi:cytochrome c553